MARDLTILALLAAALFVLGYMTGAWQWLHDRLASAVGDAIDELYGAVALTTVALAGLAISGARRAARRRPRDPRPRIASAP